MQALLALLAVAPNCRSAHPSVRDPLCHRRPARVNIVSLDTRLQDGAMHMSDRTSARARTAWGPALVPITTGPPADAAAAAGHTQHARGRRPGPVTGDPRRAGSEVTAP
jgi:hypothetical protein